MKKTFIVILMAVIILTNFLCIPKSFAEAITISLSVKLVATVLASMGVLAYVNSNSGIIPFHDEFIVFLETVKGVSDAINLMRDIVVSSISNNIKMKIENISNYIKEFYISKFKAEIPMQGVLDNPTYQLYNNSFDIVYDDLNIPLKAQNYVLNSTITKINENYSVAIMGSHTTGPTCLTYLKVVLLFKGQVTSKKISLGSVDDVEIHQWSSINDKARGYNNEITITPGSIVNIQTLIESDSTWDNAITFKFSHLTNVKSSTFTIRGFLTDMLIAEQSILDTELDDVPIPYAVPNNLAFQEGWNVSGYIGKTIEEYVQEIEQTSIKDYVDKLLEKSKSQVDEAVPPILVVDENGKITDASEPGSIPGPIETGDPVTQGILGSILAFIKSIFEIPDDLDLDLDPLKNLIPKDKFPFSLPWDLYSIINILKAEPKAPYWKLKIMNESIIIDMSQFESWAKISRNILSITYVIMLIFSTKRIMGGGS